MSYVGRTYSRNKNGLSLNEMRRQLREEFPQRAKAWEAQEDNKKFKEFEDMVQDKLV